VLLELVRAMPDSKKIEQIADLTNTVRNLAMIGLRERHPNASDEDCDSDLRCSFLAKAWPREPTEAFLTTRGSVESHYH
jgi:hypothetical protein